MATLKTNWMIASITSILIVLFGFFFVVNATEKEEVKADSKAATTYHFTSSDLNDATDPEAWSDDPGDAQNCDAIPDLPCSVNLEGSIEEYLDNKTPAQIMADPNVSKRSQ